MTHQQIEGYRLSPQQTRLWLRTDRPFRHTAQCALLVEGALRPDALAEHLRRLIDRHEILRTAFRLLPGMELPLQVILDRPAFTLRQHDAGEMDKARQRQFLDEQLRLERARSFDPEGGEVLRACLVKLAAAQHALVLSLPPLCADARTLQNIARELAELSAAAAGRSQSPDDVVQYVQFCEWQRELLESEEAAEGLRFWEQREKESAGVPAPVLPLEKSAPEGGAQAGSAAGERPARGETARAEGEPVGDDRGVVSQELGAEELRHLEAEAGRAGTGLELLLLAGWQSLLWRLTGRPEVLTRVALDGRKYEDLYESLGLFTKYAPVKTPFQKNSSLDDIIRQLEESHGQASEWQEYYSPADSDRLPERADGIGYEYVSWTDPQPAEHLTFNCEELYSHTEPLKLKLTAVNRGHRLRLDFHYDPAAYERANVERLSQQYLTLLRAAVAAPAQSLSHLALLDPRERHRLLVEFNDTGRDYPRGRTVHALFAEQAGRAPDAEAVACEGERLTYRRLDERSNQLARHLRSLG
ncbi:MAG TPA: condensation domain-containing protein, partial [Pyrinomonadaceae bacterium]|nr:condensation domain-containing protein [Pyrinomonadaceae bacterium]